MYQSETSKIRPWFEDKPYLEGKGLDLGCGGDIISPATEGFDMPKPYAETGTDFIMHAGDARNLERFPDCSYDYIYSSHLLEDFTNTSEILEEWTRVVKPGGYISLYLPDEKIYRAHYKATGQSYNSAHSIMMSIDWMRKAAKDLFLKEIEAEMHAEYSFIIVFQKMKVGMHSGDMGDVVYGIPTFKKLELEGIILNPTPLHLTKMGHKECSLLKPLLESQGFKVRIDPYHKCPIGVRDLDAFRTTGQNLSTEHLMHAQANAQGVTVEEKPFLHLTAKPSIKAGKTLVINRSLRYWNHSLDYNQLLDEAAAFYDFVFVGLNEEYLEFKHFFDPGNKYKIKYLPTKDLLELAHILNKANYFLGNQSIAYAIAEGLGKLRQLEVCPWVPNTLLHSPTQATYYTTQVATDRYPSTEGPLSTLLYCTGWMDNDDAVERYFRWLKFYWNIRQAIGVTNIAIIDDSSPYEFVFKLADKLDRELNIKLKLMPVSEENPLGSFQYKFVDNAVNFVRFNEHLGRPVYTTVPGWWRSYSYGGILGGLGNFRRSIFIESDCFILTPHIAFYIAQNFAVWSSMYAPRKGYLESSIQVMGNNADYDKIYEYFKRGRPFWFKNNLHDHVYAPEFVLQNKITIINKDFKGDRYGDDYFDEIPDDADYICNVHDIDPNKGWQVHWREKKAKISSLISSAEKTLSTLPESYYEALDNAVCAQFGVKRMAEGVELPVAEDIIKTYDSIPSRPPYTGEDKEYSDYYGEMLIDGTKMTYVIGALLHKLHYNFLHNLFSTDSGFEQKDGTFALFNRTVNILGQQMINWDRLTRKQQDSYLIDAEKVLTVLVNKFLE